ncbi:MAG: ASKHA domain-containing protein [Deltaproteobacteria bacterium]|nr:ASKHA domain-containing protein [Deltaproteobacteria bacterium]
MDTFPITFLPDNTVIEAEAGETISEVADRGKIHINASCGGEGVCGRCVVEIREGTVQASPGLYLNEDDFAKGIRLACRAKIEGPATVFIPLESRADASFFKKAAQAEEELSVQNPDPMVRQTCLILEPPTQDDNRSDLDRVNASLAELDLYDNDIDLSAMRRMPKALRESNFKVTVSIFYELPLQRPDIPPYGRIVAFDTTASDDDYYGLAVDVGTTSVWIRLMNLHTGKVMPSVGDLNGQISYGEDVISRIVFAGKKDGLKRLQSRVIDTINRLLERYESTYPGFRKKTFLMVAAGNTTMAHLLVGLDPKNIRLSPYVPPASTWPSIRASFLGINVEPHTVMKVFPSVSSYVGGDIVSGVLAAGLFKRPELTLFIDVGTNGEIVIGNQDWMTCAACSAGPAFEGGGVRCGMRAAPGAIESFLYEKDTKQHYLGVIGGVSPSGICGSGLINVVAELFKGGVLNKQGKFVEGSCPQIRPGEDGFEFLLASAENSAGDHDVVITEIDIENLIRAKGAMYSGYQTLLESVGLEMADLERVIIAGGFGRSLNIENAITIGLLPYLPVEKFSYIGNSSLTGATLAALSGTMWRTAFEIKEKMTNFELSDTPGYMDRYIASQFIPHTDAYLFGL